MSGKTRIVESGQAITILLDADIPAITIGGPADGRLQVRDQHNHKRFSVNNLAMKLGTPAEDRPNQEPAGAYSIYVYDNAGDASAHLDGIYGKLELGNPQDNKRKIELDPRDGLVKLGLPLNRSFDDRPIELEGDKAEIKVGRMGLAGTVRVFDVESRPTIKIDGGAGEITIGVDRHSGDLWIKDGEDRNVCHINGRSAAMRIGTTGAAGEFFLQDGAGQEVFRVTAAKGAVYVGGTGNGGDVIVRDDANRDCVGLHAGSGSIRVGTAGQAGTINVRKSDGTDSIQIVGESGDILLANGDCAEEFDFSGDPAAPGSVVVIDDNERLRLSTEPYDTRVAGVVSGAGRYRPAIVLDRRKGDAPRPAVAMVGKVECRVDAQHGPIRCGDLLVSSATPGHAMAATDRARAMGAVLGKALRSMDAGQGLIPILVCLQ